LKVLVSSQCGFEFITDFEFGEPETFNSPALNTAVLVTTFLLPLSVAEYLESSLSAKMELVMFT